MKYLKELFWVTVIGQVTVWSVVYMAYLLPSAYVGFVLGMIGCIIGKIAYRLIEKRV
jgi:hypothetical protein